MDGVPAIGWAWLSRTRRQSCPIFLIQNGILSVIGTLHIDVRQPKKERSRSFRKDLVSKSSEMKMQTCRFGEFRFLRFGVLGLAILSAGAWGQSGDFTVSQNGKPVGTATFSIAPSQAGGLDSTSTVRVNMQGLNYALSKTEELSSARSLVHVQLSASVNGSAVNVTAKPDGSQLLMNISANGRSSTTRLAAHDQAIFMADFDPGALETLLAIAARSNSRDLWAIIPKQSGSVQAVQLATYPDEQGTLDGNAITVHHLVATIAGLSTDLFAGNENQLLQAELPQDGFALVSKGFVLKPPTKAPAPPPVPQPSPQQAPSPQ